MRVSPVEDPFRVVKYAFDNPLRFFDLTGRQSEETQRLTDDDIRRFGIVGPNGEVLLPPHYGTLRQLDIAGQQAEKVVETGEKVAAGIVIGGIQFLQETIGSAGHLKEGGEKIAYGEEPEDPVVRNTARLTSFALNFSPLLGRRGGGAVRTGRGAAAEAEAEANAAKIVVEDAPKPESVGATAEAQNAAQLAELRTKLVRLLHERELGLDPAKGKFNPVEARVGLKLENEVGRLSRDPSGDFDWIGRGGRTFDAVGPVPSEHFSATSFTKSISTHLNKQGLDTVVVHFEGLKPAQVSEVKTYLNGLSPADRGRVKVIE